jgi:hypothetical protein
MQARAAAAEAARHVAELEAAKRRAEVTALTLTRYPLPLP